MTQKDKELLLKVLCAMSHYGVKVAYLATTYNVQYVDVKFDEVKLDGMPYTVSIGQVKPYLHPMSSMTKEEKIEYDGMSAPTAQGKVWVNRIDWLNEKKFDYRGLIPMGLALEALEGIYNIN